MQTVNERIDYFKKTIKNSFFWFRVQNYKFSYLVILVIIFMWIYNLFSIPKESTPDINIWYVTISTIYQWASPNDVYDLVTRNIESQISNIDWVKEITSNSTLWFSSIFVELWQWVDEQEIFLEIKDEIDKVSLPSDAEDPIVTRISTSNNLVYQIIIYSPDNIYSPLQLWQKAEEIKDLIEWKYWISRIIIWWSSWWLWSAWSSWGSSDFEYQIILNWEKLNDLWINLSTVVDIIRNYNRNFPLWNHRFWDLEYDFRIQWELSTVNEIMELPIRTSNWSQIKIWDIAKWEISQINNSISKIWFTNLNNDLDYIILSFEKENDVSIFSASRNSKNALDEIFSSFSFSDLEYIYTNDLADLIIKDYWTLSESAIQTIIMVFITLLIFIWLKQAILATFSLPLAFLITFIVLNQMWLTLNFLTNFSLVLTLWIAIDTIIVITEWATIKKRLWYHSKYAILLAIKELKAPLIAWASTTLVAFLPMMLLPWIMWKFLSYIPITVFATLVAALILSLTLNSPIFYRLNKKNDSYYKDLSVEQFFSEEEKLLLDLQRKWKKELLDTNKKSLPDRFFEFLQLFFEKFLSIFIKNRLTRLLTIFLPIFFLVLSFIFLAPRIWFTLMPSSDSDYFSFTIKWDNWIVTENMLVYTYWFDEIFNDIIEIDNYYYNVNNNSITLEFNLLSVSDRQKLWLKNVFEIERIVDKKLNYLREKWFTLSSQIMQSWPPSWSAVWIKLTADDVSLLSDLRLISIDFRDFLSSLEWVRTVSVSSEDTPWQFIMLYNYDNIAKLWLTPSQISSEIYNNLNWIKAWSIRQWYYDRDIVVMNSKFIDNISISDINNIPIFHQNWVVRVWQLVDTYIEPNINSVSTQNKSITVDIDWDLFVEFEARTSQIQSDLISFAENYNFPSWIWFKSWWEQEENKELLIWLLVAFLVTLVLMFAILVLQFSSYIQPLIILYSIFLALLWVNIWLYITWNPYSMTFWIWFIALTWIVVNNAIILIDRINSNIWLIDDYKQVVIQSAKSRLRPILLTTLTTIFGILPLSLQDEFWAWLWFTVIFWLASWAAMTLFVIPCIYYELFLRKKEKNI